MSPRRSALAIGSTLAVAVLTGCGAANVPNSAETTAAAAPSTTPTPNRAATEAGTVTNVCTDTLKDSTIPGSTELAEVRLARTDSGLLVEWETTGFAEGLTEFSIHAVNASDNSYFDTLYVRTADRKIVDWYWREYTGGAPALTHTLDEAPTGKSSTLRAVFPAAVLDHLGPGFGWEAAVRHDQGGHDSCPSGDGNLIFDDEE